MDGPGFARLLKQQNMDSQVWWDAAPTACESFKQSLIVKYPDTFDYIEQLLPDHFALSSSGICGATTNPGLVAQEVAREPWHWRNFVDQSRTGAIEPDLPDSDRASQLYDQVISEGARRLQPLCVAFRGAQGWLSAQVEGDEQMNARALISRGRHLARLAPNVVVKIPGSEQGYRAIEELVAQGCSINNTFCFTVSQVATCLKAIHEGRLRARATRQRRHVLPKDMCYHRLDELKADAECLLEQQHVFIIREPARAIASHFAVFAQMPLHAIGHRALYEVFCRVTRLTGKIPHVINCDELARHPQGVVHRLCDHLQLEFLPHAMHWDATCPEQWRAWRSWHKEAERSTGIVTGPDDFDDQLLTTDPHLMAYYKAHRPFYERRNQFAQQASS